MAINANTTLRRVVWELEQWASAHKMVEQFGYGKYLDVYASSTNNNYPAFIVNCPNFTMDEWYFNFSFEFVTLDWVFDGRLNHDRATSNTAELMRDLENTLRNSKRWQSFARLDTEWNGRHLDEFGGDKTFGWLTTCTIKIKKRSGICKIETLMPEYDFENQTVITPACDPVTVTVNSANSQSVASGGSLNIDVEDSSGADTGTFNANTVSIADVTQTLNGASITNNKAETSKAITIRYADDTPVVVTTITDTESTFIGEVPNVQTPINVANPTKTGASILGSFFSGDNADTDAGRGGSFYDLDSNNPFGHLKRFTGKTGGYYDDTTSQYKTVAGVVTVKATAFPNDVVLDWVSQDQVNATVLAYSIDLTTAASITTTCTSAPYTRDSLSDWRVWNLTEWAVICNQGVYRNWLNYPPFEISVTASTDYLWLGYSDNGSAAWRYAATQLGVVGGAGSLRTVVVRNYTLASLSL